MSESSIGSGRDTRYEWEQYLVGVLARLDALEAGGGGGGGTPTVLTAVGAEGQETALVDVRNADGSAALTLLAPSTGGDLKLTAANACYTYDWAYPDSAGMYVQGPEDGDGNRRSVNAYADDAGGQLTVACTPGGGTVDASVSNADARVYVRATDGSSFGNIEAQAGLAKTALAVTANSGQVDPLLELSSATVECSFVPVTDNEAAGGQFLVSHDRGDGTAHRGYLQADQDGTKLTLELHAEAEPAWLAENPPRLELYGSRTVAGVGAQFNDQDGDPAVFCYYEVKAANIGAYLWLGQKDAQTASPITVTNYDGDPVFQVLPSGDVQFFDASIGVILRSPDGGRHRLKVANDGTLSTETVT